VAVSLASRIADFAVADGCLVVENRKLTDIAREVGDVPFYVYSRSLIARRIIVLRDCLPKSVHLHYAIKANPLPDLVSFVSGQVDGLDVASERELKVALATGINPERVSFAGPGKRSSELLAAVTAGILINVESKGELQRLREIAATTGGRPKVAIRVNPDFELKSSGMKMAGGPKQFGIDAEVVPELLDSMRGSDLDFWGFHIFSGSQNLDSSAICEAQTKSVDLAHKLSERSPRPPRVVNIGGGFGIPYFPGDRPLDLAPIKENLAALASSLESRLPQTQLVIELGRFIVGEAGLYVCRVIDRKVSRGKVFLVTDGGMHHHLAASGNFGQVIRRNYPIVVATKMGNQDTERASIVGPLCTPLDLLGDNVEVSRAEVGDLVVVFQSGAYGLTASPINFLSHPVAKEVFL
jgi:diaminopimelate decarboxylase